jgi:hypothetical protein
MAGQGGLSSCRSRNWNWLLCSVSFPTQSLHRGGKHGIYIYERVVPELVDPYCERHLPFAPLTTVERILTVKAFATHSITPIKYLKIPDGMPSED